MLSTAFAQTFCVGHAIVQGSMQWIGRAELVAAVANAGGLGLLTALTQPTPEDLAEEIARTRELTDQPFVVNLATLPAVTPPYDEYRQVIIKSGIKIVETASSNLAPHLPDFHGAGVNVLQCTSVRHTIKAQDSGADDISMGTRYMCTAESPLHQNIKEAIVAGEETDTESIFWPLRNTARVASNTVSREVMETTVAASSRPFVNSSPGPRTHRLRERRPQGRHPVSRHRSGHHPRHPNRPANSSNALSPGQRR